MPLVPCLVVLSSSKRRKLATGAAERAPERRAGSDFPAAATLCHRLRTDPRPTGPVIFSGGFCSGSAAQGTLGALAGRSLHYCLGKVAALSRPSLRHFHWPFKTGFILYICDSPSMLSLHHICSESNLRLRRAGKAETCTTWRIRMH